jgi:hypothetical protein
MTAQYKHKILKRVTYSYYLRNKIAKKCIPDKLIICHGRACKRSFVKINKDKLFLDHSKNIIPDILANIHWIHKKKPKYLKSQFKYITSIYAPIELFFNRSMSYDTFRKINISRIYNRGYGQFRNMDGKFSVYKFLNSDIYFHQDFMKSLLYMLKLDGKFEFTDNFILSHADDSISSENAIRIFKKMLGEYSAYFNVSVESKSNCIDYQKKADECIWYNRDKFMTITKIKEYF